MTQATPTTLLFACDHGFADRVLTAPAPQPHPTLVDWPDCPPSSTDPPHADIAPPRPTWNTTEPESSRTSNTGPSTPPHDGNSTRPVRTRPRPLLRHHAPAPDWLTTSTPPHQRPVTVDSRTTPSRPSSRNRPTFDQVTVVTRAAQAAFHQPAGSSTSTNANSATASSGSHPTKTTPDLYDRLRAYHEPARAAHRRALPRRSHPRSHPRHHRRRPRPMAPQPRPPGRRTSPSPTRPPRSYAPPSSPAPSTAPTPDAPGLPRQQPPRRASTSAKQPPTSTSTSATPTSTKPHHRQPPRPHQHRETGTPHMNRIRPAATSSRPSALARGLAVRQLARDCGIEIAVLNRLETATDPTLTTLTVAALIRLADHLDVPVGHPLHQTTTDPRQPQPSPPRRHAARRRQPRRTPHRARARHPRRRPRRRPRLDHNRVHDAADALDAALAPVGMTVFRNSGLMLHPARRRHHTDAELAVARHPRAREQPTPRHPRPRRLLYRAAREPISPHSLSKADRVNIATLLKAGVLVETKDRHFVPAPDVAESLTPPDYP